MPRYDSRRRNPPRARGIDRYTPGASSAASATATNLAEANEWLESVREPDMSMRGTLRGTPQSAVAVPPPAKAIETEQEPINFNVLTSEDISSLIEKFSKPEMVGLIDAGTPPSEFVDLIANLWFYYKVPPCANLKSLDDVEIRKIVWNKYRITIFPHEVIHTRDNCMHLGESETEHGSMGLPLIIDCFPNASWTAFSVDNCRDAYKTLLSVLKKVRWNDLKATWVIQTAYQPVLPPMSLKIMNLAMGGLGQVNWKDGNCYICNNSTPFCLSKCMEKSKCPLCTRCFMDARKVKLLEREKRNIFSGSDVEIKCPINNCGCSTRLMINVNEESDDKGRGETAVVGMKRKAAQDYQNLPDAFDISRTPRPVAGDFVHPDQQYLLNALATQEQEVVDVMDDSDDSSEEEEIEDLGNGLFRQGDRLFERNGTGFITAVMPQLNPSPTDSPFEHASE